MNKVLRSILRQFKPIAKKIYPGYFKYDTISYWVNREGPSYYDNYSKNFDATQQAKEQEETLLAEFKKLDFSSILEYGCGYGRILKLVELELPEKKIEGCDISPDQLENSKKLLGENTKCLMFLVDGKSIPRVNNSFDIVFVCNVLQHQTHNLINIVREELFRVAKKYIILMEPNHTDEEVEKDKTESRRIDKTCYMHNHTGFFTAKGCKILKNEWHPGIGNFIIVIEKN
jgi:ubiquinone/menaquinone biosynthesis C-methylase UbiE